MANYLARVELHKASHDDYEVLHGAMKQRGFLRVIVAGNGKKYRLPTGTYVVEDTNANLEQAYAAAESGAGDTGKSFWAIVVDWTAAKFLLEAVS